MGSALDVRGGKLLSVMGKAATFLDDDTVVRLDDEKTGLLERTVTFARNNGIIQLRRPMSASRQIEQFERFAHNVLGDKKGLGALPAIPEEFEDDHTRVLVVKPAWTCNFLMDGYTGKKWQFVRDLDGAIKIDERAKRPNETYIVLCRDREAGDEELKNVKCTDLEERGGVYLLPRELVLCQRLYEYETGGHLDPETLTFCPYTRAGGCAVYVGWSAGRGLGVSQYRVDYADAHWRARSAKVLGK